jgi:putative peptide zinc metalloprotease protein
LRLLERVPLFADLPRNTLRGLAHVAQQQQFAARAVIVRQGVPSGIFYVITHGRAAVLARSEPKGDQPAHIRPVAQLGEEEFFGELELLRGTPPLASVLALTPLTVLALPHAAMCGLPYVSEFTRAWWWWEKSATVRSMSCSLWEIRPIWQPGSRPSPSPTRS